MKLGLIPNPWHCVKCGGSLPLKIIVRQPLNGYQSIPMCTPHLLGSQGPVVMEAPRCLFLEGTKASLPNPTPVRQSRFLQHCLEREYAYLCSQGLELGRCQAPPTASHHDWPPWTLPYPRSLAPLTINAHAHLICTLSVGLRLQACGG